MLLSVVTGIVGSFTHVLVWALGNIPYYTLLWGNVWRLFTYAFVGSGLLMTIASCLIMYFIMPEVVSRWSIAGTQRFHNHHLRRFFRVRSNRAARLLLGLAGDVLVVQRRRLHCGHVQHRIVGDVDGLHRQDLHE